MKFSGKFYAGDFLRVPVANDLTSNKMLIIQEDDPKAFGIFLRWLYGISLGFGSPQESVCSVLPDAQSRISIYTFAQKYACLELQDIIISDMYRCVFQGRKIVTELSQESLQQFVTKVSSSHMHTLLAKWIAKDILLGTFKDQDTAFDMVPKMLLRMMMREMHGCARTGQAQYPLGLPCDYHLHVATGVCAFK